MQSGRRRHGDVIGDIHKRRWEVLLIDYEVVLLEWNDFVVAYLFCWSGTIVR